MLLNFINPHYIEVLAALPTVILLIGLLINVRIDSYTQPRRKRMMQLLIIVVFSLILQNYLDYLLVEVRPMVMARKLVSVYGYSIRPVILLLCLHIVSPQRNYKPEWGIAAVNAFLYSLSLVNINICFEIDEMNHFHGGTVPVLRHSCLLLSLLFLGYLIYLSLEEFQLERGKGAWLLVYATLLILLAVVLDDNVGGMAQPISFLTIAVVIDCVLYYFWLHLQFVREHEKDLMANQRIQIMMTQIKPHFLYNSLGAIEALCDIDPQAAKQATVKFSQYLRGNMKSLSEEGMIPFEQELRHTMLYLDLEQIRFEDALRIEYDISCRDFRIPTLTLEPIAENAVRHGVREKTDGCGNVLIATKEYEDRYEVCVRDDGPGFDPETVPADGTHVGLQNVRERLQTVCGGGLRIDSVIGSGTDVTIILPKDRQEG